jgi:hypothetical protein
MKNKTATSTFLWMIAGIYFVSFHNAITQESSANVIQETNQVATNQTREFKIDKAITISQARSLYKASPPELQDYDQKLVSSIENRWYELMDKSQYDVSDNEKIVARFKLHQDGTVSDIKTSGNTNALAAPLCIQAIQDCSPFPKWPDKMRSIVGQDYRDIDFTFYLNQKPQNP